MGKFLVEVTPVDDDSGIGVVVVLGVLAFIAYMVYVAVVFTLKVLFFLLLAGLVWLLPVALVAIVLFERPERKVMSLVVAMVGALLVGKFLSIIGYAQPWILNVLWIGILCVSIYGFFGLRPTAFLETMVQRIAPRIGLSRVRLDEPASTDPASDTPPDPDQVRFMNMMS